MNWLKLLPLLLLTACVEDNVTPAHIDMANRLCAPNNGLERIYSAYTGRNGYQVDLMCSNGVRIHYEWS